LDKPSKVVQEWLKFSREDLSTAKILSEHGSEVTYRTIGFLCQQSAEKAIKAFLAYKRIKFEKTHDLEILGNRMSELFSDKKSFFEDVKTLTPYAVEYRYPDAALKPIIKENLEIAISIAGQLQQLIIENIK
jgi:HEPN domain-containing protein